MTLALAGTLVGLGLAELGLRQLSREQLGFKYKDGVWSAPREFKTDRRRNRLGFHDDEVAPANAGARRILLLGDSYVAGLSVDVIETVGQRLEAELNARGGPRYDVVAFGKHGWGQRDQLEALRTHGPELRPDLVLTLFLSLNDVRNNLGELQQLAEQQIEEREFFRPGWVEIRAESAPLFLIEGSLLNQWLSHRLALRALRTTATEVPLDYLVYAREADEAWSRAWSATEELLVETRAASRALGASYAVLSASTPQGVLGEEAGLEILVSQYPRMRERAFDLGLPDHRLATFCRTADIPFLALEPDFRDATRAGAELHWPRDGHWNAAGHAFAARAIAVFVGSL